LLTGCTSVLWDKRTFAHDYRPANPANLRLFYSTDRKDILVQYDESRDGGSIRPRCYWLEPNTVRVNRERKPHFVSASETRPLIPIPVMETPPSPPPPGLNGLYAVARHDDDFFSLYSGKEPPDPYKLPTYTASSQRVKQVVLTPFAVTIDATIIGAATSYYWAPQLLANLNR
jgi:hypothetical protein